jgi:hypothetical protein
MSFYTTIYFTINLLLPLKPNSLQKNEAMF